MQYGNSFLVTKTKVVYVVVCVGVCEEVQAIWNCKCRKTIIVLVVVFAAAIKTLHIRIHIYISSIMYFSTTCLQYY